MYIFPSKPRRLEMLMSHFVKKLILYTPQYVYLCLDFYSFIIAIKGDVYRPPMGTRRVSAGQEETELKYSI
jgi:hypothetical protein